MAKTKAPTGLSISRTNTKFTLTWKIADKDYGDGQHFSYIIDDTGADQWSTAQKLGAKVTSKAISIALNNFYPYNSQYLYNIGMRVKGNRKEYTEKKKKINPSASDWVEKRFTVDVPLNPSIVATKSDSLSNVCTFSWSGSNDASNSRIFTDIQWQSILVKNSKETDGNKLNWSGAETGTSGVTGSKTYTEDTSILYKNGNSYTRWVRVRARGPRGNSDWRYAYRVYAFPNQANVTEVSSNNTSSGGVQVTANWQVESNRQNPIDYTSVQYAFAVPEANLACPDTDWTDANISRDTSGTDSAVFNIDRQPALDECLYIRVNTNFDNKITYGKPTLVKCGFLKDPEELSIDPSSQTYKAIITAQNRSEIEDSVLVVVYKSSTDTIAVGVIPHGETSVTVQCPSWDDTEQIAFEVYAMVGTYEKQTRSDGVDTYSVTPKMWSQNTLSQGGAVPQAPKNVQVTKVDNISGTVQVTWDWPWQEAHSTEISWADHEDAWESTEEPSSYIISNLHASKWNISGLETGKVWYIRVRLLAGSVDNITYGPWSPIEQGIIDLSSAPNKPLLMLSNSVIAQGETVTASWVYTTTDKTSQTYAEVVLVELEDEEVQSGEDLIIHDSVTDTDIKIKRVRAYGNIVAHSKTAQFVNIDSNSLGWTTGNTYNLACRVKSGSGKLSEWSDVVSVTIAEPLTCEIAQTSLETQTVTEMAIDVATGEEVQFTREFLTLTEMPLSITVLGAGVGGITNVSIERTSSYHLQRPDENVFNGYENESIASKIQLGQEQMVFTLEDLVGTLDDGAPYRIVATVKDGLGQIASASQEFEVHWQHQAVIPSADVEVDQDNFVVKITPILPAGADPTDVVDIYRLSIDKPELIVKGAQFGETYVDPYPTLGDMGGHRIVLRTQNGDYITSDNELAMVDSTELGAGYIENPEEYNIIDFEGSQIKFYYDTDYSSTWAKDFKETQYLGGSIQGDWNPAVSRTGTLSTQAITVLDQDMLKAVRRLAEHSGICHVRTADGSSYAADIQVSENRVHDDKEMLVSYSLAITRVDSQGYEGMTLEEWQSEQSQEA